MDKKLTIMCAAIAALTVAMSPMAVRASQAPVAAQQTVSGAVIDAESRTPIAGARVAAGAVQVVTDAAGRFSIARPGGSTLAFEAAGYRPYTLDPTDASVQGAASLEVLLARVTAVTDSVVVRGVSPAVAPATRVVAPVEVLRTPGAIDNVFRALQVQPGVSATIEIGGYLSVRGGAPDQNLTVLDGVEVHDPYRLYGLASAFNPETVSQFELASGGFSAKYGDRLSSMLSIGTRDGAADRRIKGTASMSVTDANAVVEGGFPKGSWLVTGRRTYYDVVADLVSDQQFPGFTDVQSKATWLPRPGTRVTVFGLRSRQGGDVNVDNTDVDAHLYDDTANDLAWARGETTFGGRGHAMAVIGYSDTNVRTGFGASLADKGRRSNAPGVVPDRRADVTGELGMRVRDLSARHELGWALGRHTVDGGFEVHRLTTALDYAYGGARNPNAANGSSLQGGAGLPEYLLSTLEHTRAATWLEGTWQLGDRLSAVTGVRADRVGATDELLFSPRLSATWRIGESTHVRSAVGRYTQSPGYEKLYQSDYLLDLSNAAERGLTSQRAMLGSIGADHDLPGGASVRIEGYFKRFDDMLVGQLETDVDRRARVARYDFPGTLAASIPTSPIITVVPGNDGRGRAYGLDVQLTRMAAPSGSKVRGWASYTWGKAERDSYGLTFPFEYDRRHSATVVAAYQMTPRWELATTARVASGFPRTAPLGLRVSGREDVADIDRDGRVDEIVPERDDAGLLVYTPDFGGVENLQRGRLPLFARVDARVTWRPQSGRWEIYSEVLNVLNRKNAGQLTPTLEHDPTSDLPRIVEKPAGWIPLLPTLGVRFRF